MYYYDAGVTLLGGAGVVGTCAAFSGGGLAQYVPASGISGTFTVELWTDESSTKDGEIVSTRQGGLATQGGFDIQNNEFGNGGIHGNLYGNNAIISQSADSSLVLPIGTWTQIVYVVTPAGYTIYTNGTVTGSGSTSGTAILWTGDDGGNTMDVAGSPIFESSTLNYFYSGAVDELAIYPTALSADRVAAHYQTATACTQIDAGTTLVELYPNPDPSSYIGALAVDSLNLYWIDQQFNTLNRMPKAGGEPLVLVSGLNGAGAALAIDSTYAYWTEFERRHCSQGVAGWRNPYHPGERTKYARGSRGRWNQRLLGQSRDWRRHQPGF